jgi:hypothetical protein
MVVANGGIHQIDDLGNGRRQIDKVHAKVLNKHGRLFFESSIQSTAVRIASAMRDDAAVGLK